MNAPALSHILNPSTAIRLSNNCDIIVFGRRPGSRTWGCRLCTALVQ